MNRPVTLEELRALLVVGRSGSIAAAAKDLNIRQQDLRRLVDRLEKKLGSVLMSHDGDGIRLTPEGNLMVINSDRILAHLREAAEHINASTQVLKLLLIPLHRHPATSASPHPNAA
jgi:LysR family transcriptional regulator, regulator for genes of the gallate degradation pathway